MSNTFGQIFKITSFGESHGECVGVIVDGCPAGLELKKEDIQKELDKRKPAQSKIVSQRKEKDEVVILSGVFKGFTTGAPICLLVWNKNVDSRPYEKIKDLLRPGHADFTAFEKYGGFNDWRGGGRFSGRITAGFVMAGAIAKKILSYLKVEILAHTVQIGKIKVEKVSLDQIRKNVYKNPVRCANLKIAKKMMREIEKVKKEGDSLGGVIEAIALNVPVGLGEPVFDTLEGEISKAMFAIPAIKAIEFGAGFSITKLKGSQSNDQFIIKKGKIQTKTNNCGGILGGISNGMPIVFRVAVKPTPSISKPQKTVNIKKMKPQILKIEGKHDPCIVPRAVPVVENMLAVVLCDFTLRANLIPKIIKEKWQKNLK
jgi:chorismate synthase